MITRFFLLIITIVSLSSFTTPRFDIQYMNLDKVDSMAQNKLLAFNTKRIDKSKEIATHELDLYHKEKIGDSDVVAMVKGLARQLYDNDNLFQQNNSVSIYLLGEIKLNEHTTTRLVYIETDKNDGVTLKCILGINIVNRQMVSVMELANNSLLAGWAGPYTYSVRRGNKFKITRDFPSCVSGPGRRHGRPETFVIKVGNDGKVTRSFQYKTKYPPAF